MENKVIALLGQPNSGKSTLFNALTGLKQHVGNWPGKTVEKKEGHFEHNGIAYTVTDLPGTYSLSANSDEEIITRDYIASGSADVVCILADSSQLERSLYMLSDYAGITVPCFLVLNMSDVARDQGKSIDVEVLEKKLGIPVILFSAPDKRDYSVFYDALERTVKNGKKLDASQLDDKFNQIDAYNDIKGIINESSFSGYSSVWLAAKAVEGDSVVIDRIRNDLSARDRNVFDNTMSKLGLQGKSVMPFLISFGCTMGGAAGTRVIDNWGQKVLTIALAWAVPCGAAWAVIPMLSTVFFGKATPIVITVILIVMILHMWITAKIFGRHLVKPEERYGMIMELPPYHKPKWAALFRYVLGRTKDTFVRALNVVLIVAFVFFLLSYSSSGDISASILYKFGHLVEPVTKLFGLSWQTFMAFIASSLGKEGALGVLSTIFSGSGTISVGSVVSGVKADNINELLVANVPKAEALALVMAMTFNMPCIVALAATFHETHSVKWTARIALYYTGMALLIAGIAYRIGLLIW